MVYHNADASDAHQAGFPGAMDTSHEHFHMRPDRLTLIPEQQYYPPIPSESTCGCGFSAKSPDPDMVRDLFGEHECFELKLPIPWHYSAGRLVTNLAGWSVIALVLYTLIVRLLEP